MRDDDLFELFRALDDSAPTDSPAYADNLWAELDEALALQHNSGTKPPIADADIIELRPRPDPKTTRFPRRGLVAAAVIVIAGLSLILALRFEQPDGVTTVATQPPNRASTVVPTPGPRLTVPLEACQRYAESQPNLADLAERAPDGTLTVGDIEAAATALSMLRADLVASGEYTDRDIRRIGATLEALEEASIEIEMGLNEQAAGSLFTASASVEGLLLPLGTGDEVAQLCVDAVRG